MTKANFIHSTTASSTNISKTLRNIINDERYNTGKKKVQIAYCYCIRIRKSCVLEESTTFLIQPYWIM